jgi:hypothetical protein
MQLIILEFILHLCRLFQTGEREQFYLTEYNAL